MARGEQLTEQELHETHPLPSENASVSALPAMERFDGSGRLKPHDFEKVGNAFEKEFHKPLPVSANGETAVHRAMGFDHRNRIDVALVPDSAEGLWLRHYLETSKIPFYTFRSAIAGKATGAHIHIGPPSTKLASTVSGQSSVGF
jgi:hypothetical protein